MRKHNICGRHQCENSRQESANIGVKYHNIVLVMRGMKKSRLAVNSGKTKLMCLASSQKRAIMKRNGEGREFEVNIEGKRIEEMAKGTILGITWSSDLCWRYHLECVGKSYRTKSRAISQIIHYLSERRRKELPTGS